MKTVIINIGLMTGEAYGSVMAVEPEGALNALIYFSNRVSFWDSEIETYKIEQSNTEQTLVVTMRIVGDHIGVFMAQVAKHLKQEAIAYYIVEEQKGYLVGEYKENWGNEFNPKYFLI